MSLVSIVFLRFFGSNSVFFFSTVSFSNEDNHCQLYATLDFVKFIVSICEQTNDLSFTDKSAFWTSYFFFLEIMLESWGAAYTRVFTVIAAEWTWTSSQTCTFFCRSDAREALLVFLRRPSGVDKDHGSGPRGCERMASICKLHSCSITMILPNKDLSAFKIIDLLFVCSCFSLFMWLNVFHLLVFSGAWNFQI